MTDNVDVSVFDFYDPILHQEEHMKGFIGFRINQGDYDGTYVKIRLDNIWYYPDKEDYSFEWTVFGNNHNIPKENFYKEEFRVIMRDILDHMTKKRIKDLVLSTNVDKKLPIDLPPDQDEMQAQMLMASLFEEMARNNTNTQTN